MDTTMRKRIGNFGVQEQWLYGWEQVSYSQSTINGLVQTTVTCKTINSKNPAHLSLVTSRSMHKSLQVIIEMKALKSNSMKQMV